MKIKDLKEWLKTLPPEADECSLVYRVFLDDDGDNFYVKDTQIVSCGIDNENSEAFFLDEESDEKII